MFGVFSESNITYSGLNGLYIAWLRHCMLLLKFLKTSIKVKETLAEAIQRQILPPRRAGLDRVLKGFHGPISRQHHRNAAL